VDDELENGARTTGYTHGGPQWLFVVEGRVPVRTLGEPSQDVVAGEAVVIQPDEKHWTVPRPDPVAFRSRST